MMGRPFSVDWRPEDTPEALKAAYKSERDVPAFLRSNIQYPAYRAELRTESGSG